ncbi:MAG: hypothetical protein ACO1OO_04360 [Flavisolibacter sp.]
MFEFDFAFFATYSILLAVVVALFRVRRIDRRFTPFIILLAGGLLNEIISYYCIQRFGHNMVNYNVYCLFESVVIFWLFAEWKVISRRTFALLTVCAAVFWNTEYFIRGYALEVNSWYVIAYSFSVAIMSIRVITDLLYKESYRLYRNANFLIACAFLLFFACSMVLEVFWVFRIMEDERFQVKLYGLFNYVNLFTNLVFAVAVLWIPSRPRSILALS